MADCRISCVRKPNRNSPHEHITHVGNPSANWMWPREDVIRSIEQKTNTFFVLDPTTGNRSEVGVVYPQDGRSPFLKTYADGEWDNNLLSFPECP
jgi:hypothetical protein